MSLLTCGAQDLGRHTSPRRKETGAQGEVCWSGRGCLAHTYLRNNPRGARPAEPLREALSMYAAV